MMRFPCDNNEITSLDRDVAQRFIEISSSFPEQTRWIAERQLYNRILNCPFLLQDGLMNSFYSAFTDFNSVRHFSEIEITGKDLFNIEIDPKETLLNNHLRIDSLSVIIDSLVRAMTNSTDDVERLELQQLIMGFKYNVTQIYGQTDALIRVLSQGQRLTLSLLAIDNLLPTYSELYELNEQEVNNIYLSGISAISPPSNMQIAQLESIASQCPYSGGPAVYKARAVLLSLGYYHLYDDKSNCIDQGILWRAGIKEIQIDASLLPNPTENTSTLQLKWNEEEKGNVVIYDLVGKIVFSFNIDNSIDKYAIPVGNLPSGIYSLVIEVNNKVSKQIKLCIVH